MRALAVLVALIALFQFSLGQTHTQELDLSLGQAEYSFADPLTGKELLTAVSGPLTFTTTADDTCTFTFNGNPGVTVSLFTTENSTSVTLPTAAYPYNETATLQVSCGPSVSLGSLDLTLTSDVCVEGSRVDNYCVCYSSNTGRLCDVPSTAGCTIPTPVPGGNSNPPSLDSTSSLIAGQLHLVVVTNFVATRQTVKITLGDNSSSVCEWPGANWEASTSGCQDVLTSSIPWEDAVACGIIREDRAETIVYNGTIIVTQTETAVDDRGIVTFRSFDNPLRFQVVFSKTIEVSTSVQVFSQVGVFGTLAATSYDASDRKGLIDVRTTVQWPFMLTNENIQVDTAGLTPVVTLKSQNCGFNSVNSVCDQMWSVSVTAAANLCKLDGIYTTSFTVECRNTATCPLDASTNSSSIQMTVVSADFCALVQDSVDLQGAVTNVGKPGYFVGDTASFQAVVSSDQVEITGVSILSATTTFKTISNVVYNPAGDTTADVGFAVTASTATSVNFSFNLLETVYPLVQDENSALDVSVKLEIIYQEANVQKRTAALALMTGTMKNEYKVSFFFSGLALEDSSVVEESSKHGSAHAAGVSAFVLAVLLALLI